ncbi:hypothetical protein THRCLA_01808 [Thraustotheca clavata]|uniref:C2 DOCK-type domain-containing protein n=1 Tax=Thraustotheca clavata TaxID=74557 RepID=A0A1W0A759_9STRA|nr:hypothetical protein THRCLA_01808 [Thraustotheca clavata]
MLAMEKGPLEVSTITRKIWHKPPTNMHETDEFTRPWRVLRSKKQALSDENGGGTAEKSLLHYYEPNVALGVPLFQNEVHEYPFFRDVTAVEGSTAYKVACNLSFNLGKIEPLQCRLILFDLNLGCRVSEDYCFDITTVPTTLNIPSKIKSALFYATPTQTMQNLYLVLQVSKVLQGDGEVSSLPYCQPEKYMSDSEQSKLIEKAAEAISRLGNVYQSLAWGAVSLIEGTRQMILYRQKMSMNDEQRLPLLIDASKGVYKEKVVACSCELDIERIDDVTVKSAKKRSLDPKPISSSGLLYLIDPMLSQHPLKEGCDNWCREIQPFCTTASQGSFGLTSSGPVAVSYINTLYLYPLSLEKFQNRNVLVKVQLVEEKDSKSPLPVFYSGNSASFASEALCHVTYHSKTPAFEDEIKIALPEQLTAQHHMRFSFYQVHCKKMPIGKSSMDIFGEATLPLLDKDGIILQDASHNLPVVSFEGDGKGMAFQCRSRLLSSLHAQNKSIHTFLQLNRHVALSNEELSNRIVGLRKAPDIMLRYHALRIFRNLRDFLCYDLVAIRQAAFVTLLVFFDKCASWNPYKAPNTATPSAISEATLVWQLIDFTFDEVNANQDAPVYQTITNEWVALMTQPQAPGEAAENRRLALTHSNLLLYMILKSIALQWAGQSLPQSLESSQEESLSKLLTTLFNCVFSVDDGFLLRKELLQSLTRFVLQLFLVIKSPVPAIWLKEAISTMSAVKDSPIMIHMTFPFLRMIAECEHFISINNITSGGISDAWLAQQLFSSLLDIIDDQNEEKTKSQAIAIFRRMFVVQANTSNHQRLALMFLPVLPRLLQFTQPLKILSPKSLESEDESSNELSKRELLICLAYCLHNLPETHRKWHENLCKESNNSPLHTKKFTHQRKIATLLQTRDGNPPELTESLENHLTSGLHLLRQLIECFLADGIPWQQLLSPETLEQGNRMSLLDIEVFMKHRNNNNRLLQNRRSNMESKEHGSGVTHKSLPRNWGKNYMAHRKSSMDQKSFFSKEEGESPAAEFDQCAKNLRKDIVSTIIESAEALIFEFASVLDMPARALNLSSKCDTLARRKATMLLGNIVDMWSLLLTRIGHIHFDSQLLGEVLIFITEFLQRFQQSLFAEASRCFMVDEAWCERILFLASAPSESIAPLAATLLCELFRTSFDQLGCFMTVKKSVLAVISKQFDQLSLISAITYLRQVKCGEGIFRTHFHGFIDLLYRLQSVSSRHQDTVKGVQIVNAEEFENEILDLMSIITPHWMPTFHLQLMYALAHFHLVREQYAEASFCHLAMVELHPGAQSRFILEHWKHAKELAIKALMPEVALAITEKILCHLRTEGLFAEYSTTIKSLDSTLTSLTQQSSLVDPPPINRYFFVSLIGAVNSNEYIYKRSAFSHISDIVADLESSFTHELGVKVKSISARNDSDVKQIVYLKVTPVDANKTTNKFVLNSPFTLHGSKYDRNQFIRRTTLSVAQSFPYLSRRQRVLQKSEIVCCPIENAKDDIIRRAHALTRFIEYDSRGIPTDLKALTHVLKGSINTEVNGGAPEVISQFLSKAADGTLLNASGDVMNLMDQTHLQKLLRSALLSFLTTALNVLALSREAFRRQSSEADLMALAPLQTEFEKGFVSIVSAFANTFDFETDEINTLKLAITYKLGLSV